MQDLEAATVEPVGPLLERSVRPVAWMWMQATWLDGDVRGRGWYPRICRQKPNMPWMEDGLQPLYDQAALDNARARIAALEATEEGAKVAFGHVVDAKRAAEKECRRLQELLDAAYAQIRRLSRV